MVEWQKHQKQGKAVYIKKITLYTIYSCSQIFAQSIQYTYILKILENIQYTIYSSLKSIFNVLSEYTFKIINNSSEYYLHILILMSI